MDAKRLVEVRKQAEDAVQGMADGDMKVKAFEVILAHLLSGGVAAPVPSVVPRKGELGSEKKQGGGRAPKATASGRVLVLRDEGFFKTQRTIGEVREELSAHGWHYPVTSLSGPLQSLVRQQELRRVRVTDGGKKIWKYSNY